MAYQFVGAKADPLARKGLSEVKSQLADITEQISQLATLANMSLTNELINSSFEDDLNAWINRGGPTYATIDTEVKLLGGKSLRLTAPDSAVARAQDINGSIGDKWYVTAHVYKRSGTGAMVYVLAKGSAAGSIGYVMHSEAYNGMAVEVWTRYSSVTTATNDGIRVQMGRTSSYTFDFNVDGVCAINLTAAFGAGNEPTVAEMDALLAILPDGWFEGTLTLTQKQITTWMLNLIRANTAAIVAL